MASPKSWNRSTVALAMGVSAALWAGYLGLLTHSRLDFQADSIERLEGAPQPISLPYHDDNRTEPALFRFSGQIKGKIKGQAGKNTVLFHVLPDDCLEALTVAGHVIDLHTFARSTLCNWRNGFFIDLGPELTGAPIEAPFEATVRNLSGAVGFNISGPAGFTIENTKLQALATEPRPARLPIRLDTDPEPMSYLVRGHLTKGWIAGTRVQIIPDDCLDEFTIDGKSVDLSSVSHARRCDYAAGFELDLAGSLGTDARQFTAKISNIHGPYGLAIYGLPSPWEPLFNAIGLIFLFTTFWWGLVGKLPEVRMRAAAALCLTVAFALRYDVIFRLHPAEAHAFSDADNYLHHAMDIARGYFWIGQTFQGIGYPVILAGALKLGGGGYAWAHALHFAVSAATVILGWRASARILGEKLGLWALMILSFHFPFLGLAGFFMAETLFGFGIAILFYWLARYSFPWSARESFAMGVLHVVSGAFKGLNALFPPLLFVWALGHVWRLGLFSGSRRDPRLMWRRALRPLAFFALGVGLSGLAQGAITYRYYGKFQLSAPTGALNLVEGKCPEKLNRDSNGSYWLSPLFAQLGETREKRWPRPFSDQDYFWKAGLNCIRANPAVLITSLRYVYFLFLGNELWPPNMTRFKDLNRRYALLFALIMLPGIVVGLARAARQPFATRILPYLPAFAIVLCAWALKSEMRYRIPFDCVFIAAGIAGWAWIIDFVSKRLGRERLPGWAPELAFGATFVALSLFAGLPLYLSSP